VLYVTDLISPRGTVERSAATLAVGEAIRKFGISGTTIAGGHEYMCRGRDAVHRMNLCRNHWGDSWNPRTIGVKQPGEFWLPDADLRTLLANQGDVTVLRAAAV